MGQKDLREKLLEDYEDVFSDIFNVLVFKNNTIRVQYSKESILGLDYTEEEYGKAESKLIQTI